MNGQEVRIGDTVTYELGSDRQGRTIAERIRVLGGEQLEGDPLDEERAAAELDYARDERKAGASALAERLAGWGKER